MLIVLLLSLAAPTVQPVQPFQYTLHSRPPALPKMEREPRRPVFDEEPLLPSETWKGIEVAGGHLSGTFMRGNKHRRHFGRLGHPGPGPNGSHRRRGIPLGVRFRSPF